MWSKVPAVRSSSAPSGEERFALAAQRLLDGDTCDISCLRRDQREVFYAFADYLGEVARGAEARRWAHIVLPPRTGKTVLAAQIARATGLHAAFVVPTRVLVEQVREQLARFAPEVPVGVFFGEGKRTVARGVNITTYASLVSHRSTWPDALASAELVFVDEAHHALSTTRRRALAARFRERALRVAMTATPDYDAGRRLDTLFPRSIARVELRDALDAGLLAPAQIHVAEVDVDGSTVELVAGEYRPDQLGRLLRGGPFLHAAMKFRYGPAHRHRSCMLACVSRKQAWELHRYLLAHRPSGSPPPEVILGETPAAERARILEAFQAGHLDTVIQVGVLIEGWSAPRCKLLIDLAPGRSRVRATQKYFRALTRDGDAHAHIVVLLPRDLERPPVLPMDLLLEPGETYRCGQVIGATRRPVEALPATPIRAVRLVQRIVICARLGVPRLRVGDLEGLRRVLQACRGFDADALPGRQAFERLYLQHPLFSGTGRALLQWSGVPRAAGAYDAWLGRLFPEQLADRWLGERGEAADAPLAPLPRALTPEIPTPEEALLRRESIEQVRRLMDGLKPRQRRFLAARYGLEWLDPQTYSAIGAAEEVSRERTRQIILGGVWNLRSALLAEEAAIPLERGRDQDLINQIDPLYLSSERAPALRRARAARREGRSLRAEALLRGLLASHRGSQNPWGHLEMAALLEARGEAERAGKHMSQAIALGPPALLAEIGCELRERGLYERAARVLQRAGASAPRWLAADCWLRLDRPRAAVEWLEGGWSLQPPDRYHLVLASHLAGLRCGKALLWAIGGDPALGRALASLQPGAAPSAAPYVAATAALWTEAAGARERLALWLDAPPVQRWCRGRQIPAGRIWLPTEDPALAELMSHGAEVCWEMAHLDPWAPRGAKTTRSAPGLPSVARPSSHRVFA
jgi:superfamily II DNA or RNA helicase/DNA-directed RNA polymerase specialized sigma24 family protein